MQIEIKIRTALPWEFESVLKAIETKLCKRVECGTVTLYAEFEEDLPAINTDIYKVWSKAENIRGTMA